jgi:PKD repeat protein
VLTTSFQFSAQVYEVANTQPFIDITVTRTTSSGEPSGGSVSYSAAPSKLVQPSARPGVDFTPVSGTLDISFSQDSATFRVEILNGGTSPGFINPVYYVDLTLSNPSQGTELGEPSYALLRITTTGPSMLTLTPYSLHGAQNIQLGGQIAMVQDSVANLQSSSYKAIMNWGDGTGDTMLSLQPQGSAFTVNGSHTFSLEGTYTYKLTVVPAHGAAATTTGQIVVGGFVTGLYNDLFQRGPDQGGLQFWDTQIANGVSRQQVAFLFWNSPEHQGVIVQQLYQSFLGRSADAAGLAYWTNFLTSGGSGADAAVAFSTSAEFIAAHPTNNLYLFGVYQAVEGTLPDPTNLLFGQIVTAFNLGLLSRADVTATILGLPETYTNAIDQYFEVFLDRVPDPAGRAFYTAEILSGNFTPAMIGSQILGSDEYLIHQDILAINGAQSS